jgi:phosphate transport system permease protein
MTTTPTSGTPSVVLDPEERAPLGVRRARRGEQAIIGLLALCGAISVLTTVGLVVVLLTEAAEFFRDVPLLTFFTDTRWEPFGGLERGRFGVLPLLTGTLLVTAIAMAIAIPVGLGTAVYLAEYAPRRLRGILKPTLEILAGIPTIVLGVFALNLVTPLLRALFGVDTVDFFNAASAGIVMGIMIVPTIASLSEDAMAAVPGGLRESAYGLGATKRQVALRVVVPGALSGIVASVILGFGRAIGETMIVAIAAGNNPELTLNPFSQIQTMTAYVVQAVGGEASRGSLTYKSIFAVGALLFVLTFGLNLLAQRFVRRYREVY